MTLEEQGAYIRLLCHEWLEGSIPSNLSDLAKICGISRTRMSRVWRNVSSKFECGEDGARLCNARLEQYRNELLEKRSRQSQGGKEGAAKRWADEKPTVTKPVGNPLGKAMGSDSSAVTTATNISSVSSNEETGASPAVENSKPPDEPETPGQLLRRMIGSKPDRNHAARGRIMGELRAYAWLASIPPEGLDTDDDREAQIVGQLLGYTSETDIKLAIRGARKLLGGRPFSAKILLVRGFFARARDANYEKHPRPLSADVLRAIAEGIAA